MTPNINVRCFVIANCTHTCKQWHYYHPTYTTHNEVNNGDRTFLCKVRNDGNRIVSRALYTVNREPCAVCLLKMKIGKRLSVLIQLQYDARFVPNEFRIVHKILTNTHTQSPVNAWQEFTCSKRLFWHSLSYSKSVKQFNWTRSCSECIVFSNQGDGVIR